MIKVTYFVHGTTTDNEAGLSSGWKDVELSELGVKQSTDLKDQINVNEFDVIFCSDLKRAVDSTKLTFGDDPRIKIDLRLRECNYGDLNGAPSEKVEPLCEKVDQKLPNGESYKDVEKRISDFIGDLKKNYDSKHIAIVAHKAPQIVLDILLNGKTYKQAFADDWRKTKSWRPGWEYEI
jgi:alpha-ribazole phosphatase/probable phosphoglycerate mutase